MNNKIFKKFLKKIYSRKISQGQVIFQIRSLYGFNVILDISKDVDRRFLLFDFETSNFELLKKIIKNNWTILDVGANIGLYSLFFATKIGTNGKVYAFEPSEDAYCRLSQNIKLNKQNNIEILKLGVADLSGTSEFHITQDDAYNSLGQKPMREVIEKKQIQITSIDDFISKRNIPNVDVLKIDTEGAEYLVLKGASTLLSQINAPIILCEYNRITEDGYNYQLNDMIDLLKSYNYTIYEIVQNKLIEFDPKISKTSDLICLKGEKKTGVIKYIE